MSDYISRQDAIDAIDEIETEVADGLGFQYEKWRNHFSEKPSAQKKGEWILMESDWDDNTWQCSVCGEPFVLIEGEPDQNGYYFCPNCGADMRGNKNE